MTASNASNAGCISAEAAVKQSGGHAKCPLCPESFFSELSLESHVHSMHQGQSIQCDECPHSFPSYTYLKLHKNMYHPSPNFPLRSAFQLAALTSSMGQPQVNNKEDAHAQLPPLVKKKEAEKVLDLSSPVKPLTTHQSSSAVTASEAVTNR